MTAKNRDQLKNPTLVIEYGLPLPFLPFIRAIVKLRKTHIRYAVFQRTAYSVAQRQKQFGSDL